MTTREFLKECEDMALHNMFCYENKAEYTKQYEQEKEKLAIIRKLINENKEE